MFFYSCFNISYVLYSYYTFIIANTLFVFKDVHVGAKTEIKPFEKTIKMFVL